MTAAPEIAFDEHVLFDGLSSEERAAVAEICRQSTVEQGTVIIEEGSRDRDLYVVVSGTVCVETTDEEGRTRELATLESGAIIGELALVVGQPRTADVVACERCTLLRLDAEAFLNLRRAESLVAYKIEHNILEHLVERQTTINEQLIAWLRRHDDSRDSPREQDDIAQLRELAETWKF